MKLRPLLLSAVLGLTALGTLHAPPAHAGGHVGVGVNLNIGPPPPPRYERPYVQPGYQWTPGHWSWDGYQYVWIAGYAVPLPPPPPVVYYGPPRPPYYYRPPVYRNSYYRPPYRPPYGYGYNRGSSIHFRYHN